jgi:CubicO group peptidase (beta-lactamase class C family)
MDAALDQFASADGPGIALCVIADGRVRYRGARGLADLEHRKPMTASIPVYIASLAKGFTGAAVLRLVEQRRIGLDDPVGMHLPGLPAYFERVTIRHLLAHESGVPDYEDALSGERGLTNREVMAWLREQPALEFPAGSRWKYSNAGYVVLAEMVARLTGKPLAAHLESEFFVPLGMSSTFIASPETAGRERAVGYTKENGEWARDDYEQWTVGPGGVYASADDMCTWGQALDGGKVLKRMTLAAAFTPQVTSGAAPTPSGLAFQVEDIPQGPLAGGWYAALFGMRDGFRAVDLKLKDRDFRYVQLSNCGDWLEPLAVPNLYAQGTK